jgi:hypothetical protein
MRYFDENDLDRRFTTIITNLSPRKEDAYSEEHDLTGYALSAGKNGCKTLVKEAPIKQTNPASG